MLISELLTESPEKDLDRVRYAQRSIGKITNYLHRKNETVPLEDCGFQAAQAKGDDLWMFPVTDAGLPQRDLWFAIGWRRNGNQETSGYVTRATIGGTRVTLLVMLLKDDPRQMTDIAFRLNYSTFTHEFSHVLDYRRGYEKHADRLSQTPAKAFDPNEYFNRPSEFNAYYQEGVAKVLFSLAHHYNTPKAKERFVSEVMLSFGSFYRSFKIDFTASWLAHMNAATERRFKKRLYKLFHLVKTSWPDMKAIHDIQAEQAEHEND